MNLYQIIAAALFAYALIEIARRVFKSRRVGRELDERIEKMAAGELEIPPEFLLPEIAVPEIASQPARIEIIESWLSELHRTDRFNGGILITQHGQPLLMQTFGWANADRKRPLTNQLMFRLASVSKQFTAAGILLLVEREMLKLDQPVVDIISNCPYQDVTIRHLLNQTSGIPDKYMEIAQRQKRKIGKRLSISKAVELVNQNAVARLHRPNECYEYSNTNYVLLAGIVEVVCSKSFEDFMREEIFEPLGMKHTRVWNLFSSIPPSSMMTESFMEISMIEGWVGKLLGDRIKLEPDFLDGIAGDGGVFSSLEDLLIWNSFWESNVLISPALIEQAFERPALSDGTRSDYGFGWVIRDDGRWHNGSWLGANTFVAQNVQTGISLYVLDNSNNFFVDGIAALIEQALNQDEPD